jgi:hypothetical protein
MGRYLNRATLLSLAARFVKSVGERWQHDPIDLGRVEHTPKQRKDAGDGDGQIHVLLRCGRSAARASS